nr:alpha/beta hydrolase [Acetatifactor sp.]
ADAVETGYQLMKDDFTTYVFDRRKEISADYSIRDMAGDTAEAMREIGLKDVYLFGASQGGMIAMVIAIEYPELVKKLVLGSTSSHVMPKQQEVIDKWIQLALEKDRQALYRSFGKEIYPADVYQQYEGYFDEVSQTVTDEELERFVILAGSILSFHVTDELRAIQCPVLTIGVYEDAVLDSDATMEIAEKFDDRPDFKLYMYVGYGHAAFDTAPDYRDRIYQFFMR